MDKQASIAGRLKAWLGEKQISTSEFADQVKIQRSALSHIFSGRNKPSVDVLTKIKNAHPDISLDWLITGKLPDPIDMPDSEIWNNAKGLIDNNVTDVNTALIPADNQDIDKINESKLSLKANGGKLIRIIELYSDGTFKSYDC